MVNRFADHGQNAKNTALANYDSNISESTHNDTKRIHSSLGGILDSPHQHPSIPTFL